MKKGLHSIFKKETCVPFVTDGKSDYKIVVDEKDAFAKKAAEFIVSQVLSATGATLPVLPLKEKGATPRQIVLGNEKTLNVVMPNAEYGKTGYYIRTTGESVLLCVKHAFGYQGAALAFLKATLGYAAYAPDTIVFHGVKNKVCLPELEITEKSDIDLRISGNNQTNTDGAYAMGYSNRWDYTMQFKGTSYHTSLLLAKTLGVDPSSDHPWLSDDKKDRGRQLCYTAHGDERELENMLSLFADSIVKEAELPQNSHRTAFTLGIEDCWGQCSCPACMKEKEKYGTDAAVTIKFFNRLSRKIQAAFQKKADETGTKKREFTLLFFGYKFNEAPPVKYENGQYVPADESVVCDDDVGVFFAPIAAKFAYPFDHSVNVHHKEWLSRWSAVCKHIRFWGYQTNFTCLLYPNGILRSLKSTYEMCLDSNVEFVYNQGSYVHMTTHFTPLKEYLDSALSFDCSLQTDALIDEFFENYFGPANLAMRKMFDSLELYYRHLLCLYPHNCTGWIYDEVNRAKYWSEALLKGYLSCIDEAYEAIDEAEKSNSAGCATFREHVLRESLFPRFALLELYPESFSEREQKQAAESFKRDCEHFGITHYGEGEHLLAEYYKRWEIGV